MSRYGAVVLRCLSLSIVDVAQALSGTQLHVRVNNPTIESRKFSHRKCCVLVYA